ALALACSSDHEWRLSKQIFALECVSASQLLGNWQLWHFSLALQILGGFSYRNFTL
ncbi:hypothetical protein BD777DRAFT_128999, partial [Yarrowia lipolytica]